MRRLGGDGIQTPVWRQGDAGLRRIESGDRVRVTNNYRYKLGRGRIERLEPSAEKFDFKGPSLRPRGLA